MAGRGCAEAAAGRQSTAINRTPNTETRLHLVISGLLWRLAGTLRGVPAEALSHFVGPLNRFGAPRETELSTVRHSPRRTPTAPLHEPTPSSGSVAALTSRRSRSSTPPAC